MESCGQMVAGNRLAGWMALVKCMSTREYTEVVAWQASRRRSDDSQCVYRQAIQQISNQHLQRQKQVAWFQVKTLHSASGHFYSGEGLQYHQAWSYNMMGAWSWAGSCTLTHDDMVR